MSEKKKILVVDDEPDVMAYLTALFEDNGHEVVGAGDGKAGLEKAREESPDLITLDLSMPEQSGVRTYRTLKQEENLKNIPVIIVTAVGDEMRHYLAKLRGFPFPEGFMNKPIVADELLKMVSDLLNE